MARRLSPISKHSRFISVSGRAQLSSILHRNSVATDHTPTTVATPPSDTEKANMAQPATFEPSVRAASETKYGLLHFVSPSRGEWRGEVKLRFTDFMVNEIRRDGQVLHLEDYSLAEQSVDPVHGHIGKQQDSTPTPDHSPKISEEDVTTLQKLVDTEASAALTALHEKIVASGNTRLDAKANFVKLPPMDRSVRGQVHQEIRRIFSSRIETQTDTDGIITAIPAAAGRKGRNTQRSNLPAFKKLGGDHLHFTLYKENKDTMDALSLIGRVLKIRPNVFGFAGTKDRRAATVQRVSVPRVRHQTLDYLNTQIPAIKMGDYKYSQHPIQLGDHGGNEFKITVKDVKLTRDDESSLERRVQLAKDAVGSTMSVLATNGFINYFGHQRFGTHAVGTHELGKLMLMEKYEDVVNGLLYVDDEFMKQVLVSSHQETPFNRDTTRRARAIHQFGTGKNIDEALKILPKRFNAEANVIQRLQKSPRDFHGAILTVPRHVRNLYLHAYQSFVWNHTASYRWSKYGSKVVAGDLVLITSGDSAAAGEDEFQRARPLSEEEAQSDKYTVFDVVLPSPGFDVIYPENDVGDFYVEFMSRPENGGLDPQRMRRTTKDFSISGAYRHFIGRFKTDPKWEVRTYLDDNEQMVPTDVDLIEQRKKAAAAAPARDAPLEEKKQADERQPSVNADDTAIAKTGERRRREDASEEESPSKRLKLSQDTHASPRSASGAPVLFSKAQSAAKPVRQPTVPQAGSVGFTNFSPVGPAPTLAEESNKSQGQEQQQPVLRIVNQPGMEAIPSFTQADLSGAKEEDVKIAVVLGFQLNASSYATVVLRELMAEFEG